MKDKTVKYQKEDLPDGWNEELEKVYDMEKQKNFLKMTTQKLTPIQYKVLCKQLWEHQKKK